MKKAVLCFLITLFIIPQSSYAKKFYGIGLANNAKGKVLDNTLYGDTSYLTFMMGEVSENTFGVSYLLSGGVTLNNVNSTGNSNLVYSYTIINASGTLNIGAGLFAFAGVGYSFEDGSQVINNITYRTKENNNQFNTTYGLGYNLEKFGVTINYDTASEASSFNILLGF